MSDLDVSNVGEDPRLRIPRGSSDEEIDSNLSSGQASLNSDSGDELVPFPDHSPRPAREAVTNTAAALTKGLSVFHPSESEPLPIAEDDDDNEILALDALAKVTAAATPRDLSLSAARRVDSCSSIAPSTLPVASIASAPSHPDMIGRIISTLHSNRTHDTVPAPALKPLEKKIAQLNSEKAARLTVPLPVTVSARLERAEAYKQATEAITKKWSDTVNKNRRAEHLYFPIDQPQCESQGTSNLASKPSSKKLSAAHEHEREIAVMLKEAGVSNDKEVIRTEEDAVNDALFSGKVSKEDVLRRQQELARVRSLVFHYDQKLKRIKRIKSKRFRREMKKDRQRLEHANGPDPKAEYEEALIAERRRIEERVTQRHKNTSKWVRRQLQREEGKRDDATRAAIEDQLRLHEELKRRQLREVGNRESESDDDYESDIDPSDVIEEEEIAELEQELQNGGTPVKTNEKKGIMSLRFMKAAESRKRREALALLNEMKNDGNNSEEVGEAKVFGRNTFSGKKERNNRNVRETEESTTDNAQATESGPVDGLIENKDESDVEQLERLMRKEYDDAVDGGLVGDMTDRNIDSEVKIEAVRSVALANPAFTTHLDGRLTADDDNPWLNGLAIKQKSGFQSGLKKVASMTGSRKPTINRRKTHIQESSQTSKVNLMETEAKTQNRSEKCEVKQNEKDSKKGIVPQDTNPTLDVNAKSEEASYDKGLSSKSYKGKETALNPTQNVTDYGRVSVLASKQKRTKSALKLKEALEKRECSSNAHIGSRKDSSPGDELKAKEVNNAIKCNKRKKAPEEGADGDSPDKEVSKSEQKKTNKRKNKRRRGAAKKDSKTVAVEAEAPKIKELRDCEGHNSSDSDQVAPKESDIGNNTGIIDNFSEENKKPNIMSEQVVNGVNTPFDNTGNNNFEEISEATNLKRMEEIALAFAGSGGADLSDFEAIKAAEVEENLPTAKSINAEVLPGWGTWDGAGMSEKARQRKGESAFARAARERLEAARAEAIKSRTDRKMRNVILEQKRYHNATKLTMASVPYPFTTREQWEQELSRPLCRELVSNNSFREDVRRKVNVRPGTVLGPIKKPIITQSSTKSGELLDRRGKTKILDLRKAKSKHRSKTRRGLMS